MLKLRKSRQIARENLLTAKQKSKQQYDKTANVMNYKVGDLVHIMDNRPKKSKMFVINYIEITIIPVILSSTK